MPDLSRTSPRDDAAVVLDLVAGNVIDPGMAWDVTLLLVVRLNLPEQLHGGLELLWV
jgi:hypothetical protein